MVLIYVTNEQYHRVIDRYRLLDLWYYKSMKSNTKSSITLPPSELQLVEKLQKRLKMKTKVAVIRRGLTLLNETTERELLRSQFKTAAEAVRDQMKEEMAELDGLTSDGLDEV
jgi:hypothetical protein